MNPIAVIHVDAVVDVLEDEDDAFRQLIRGGDNCVQTAGLLVHVAIAFHVIQQVKAELVKAQVHDGNAVGHILNIDDFLLQTPELRLAVFEIALFLRVNQVVISGGGHDGYLHAGLHAGFQIDIIVQRQVRPEVHQLYGLILAPDTVDTPEALDNAHRVPVNIVVNEVVAVLKVLAFRNTIGRNQDVNFRPTVRHQHIAVL